MAAAACTQQPESSASLYERLGGLGTITNVVDKFVDGMAADERLAPRFAASNPSRLKIRIIQQLCEASGGPCKYQGQPMTIAHKGMNVTNEEFGVSLEALAKALDEAGVAAPEKNELLALVGVMENQIVGK
ncbi:MAG: group 1 truncated hemoglobin [Alphaproteobacteria bacterium]